MLKQQNSFTLVYFKYNNTVKTINLLLCVEFGLCSSIDIYRSIANISINKIFDKYQQNKCMHPNKIKQSTFTKLIFNIESTCLSSYSDKKVSGKLNVNYYMTLCQITIYTTGNRLSKYLYSYR